VEFATITDFGCYSSSTIPGHVEGGFCTVPGDKLSRLTARRDALNAQIRREQNREKSKLRKDDTRRKILAGARC
jgi:hypothetical protein